MIKNLDMERKTHHAADVCPKEAWTTDANKCQELREKQLCADVKSCGDLYGEAAKTCGFCPTTGKSNGNEKSRR